MRRFIGAALIVAATSALVACGSSSPQPSPSASVSTGVHGIVLTNHGGWVGSPVALPDGFGTVTDLYPYGGAAVVIRREEPDASTPIVARLRADARGLFTYALPPGRYGVATADPSGGGASIVVTQGHVSRVRIQGPIEQ